MNFIKELMQLAEARDPTDTDTKDMFSDQDIDVSYKSMPSSNVGLDIRIESLDGVTGEELNELIRKAFKSNPTPLNQAGARKLYLGINPHGALAGDNQLAYKENVTWREADAILLKAANETFNEKNRLLVKSAYNALYS